ncbi:MAG: DUF11 domain-containing protein [Phycisphaerales bacterium]|nr:DUF11 domain-containing protein [Phycisphaerales bacterium]
MNVRNVFSTVSVVALIAGGVTGMSGCQSSNKSTSTAHPATWNPVIDTGKAKPAPAPAKPAPAAAPAPAPKPVAMTGGNSMFFPTGDRASSGLMVTSMAPAQVRAGQPYDYKILVQNITGGTLQNVIVGLENSSNMSIIESNPAASAAAGGRTQWSLGDLGAGQTREILVKARADKAGADATNCLSAMYNNTLCSRTMVVEPALALTKTATPQVVQCDPIELCYVVKNPGTGVAENVVIRDTLAAGLMVDGKNAVEIPIGNLAGGQEQRRCVRAMASQKGRFESGASAAAAGGLGAQAAPVATVVTKPALALECKAPAQVFLGRNATFEFTVRNTGDAPANNTMVSAALPAGATLVSASDNGAGAGGALNWNLGTLAPGATKTLSATIKGAQGSVALSGRASGVCADPVSTNCTTNVVGIPAMLLDGFDNPDPVEVGQNVTYTLIVTNQGSAPLTNIRFSATMPEGDAQQFVSATPVQSGVQGRTITFPAIPTLAPGQKFEYRIVMKAMKEGQVSFVGQAVSNEITVPLIKAETTNLYK